MTDDGAVFASGKRRMASERRVGYRASTLLIACAVSFLLGRQMPAETPRYSSNRIMSTVTMDTATNLKRNTTTNTITIDINSNDKGWSQVDVFYGDSQHLKKRLDPLRTWSSQARQDELVWTLLNKRVGGYFVDLAANDATYLSNTYTLETFYLWKGLCIEANPRYWHGLASRPKCQVVGAVVGHTTMEKVDFTYNASGTGIHEGGLYGGIVHEDFDNTESSNKDGYVTEPRYTITLSDLFQRYNVPAVIDYLSLDVEGAESYIMKSFPFDRYKIKLMTVERPKNDLRELLKEAGYVLLTDTISNFGETIYCHKSVLSRLDFKSAGISPPSASSTN